MIKEIGFKEFRDNFKKDESYILLGIDNREDLIFITKSVGIYLWADGSEIINKEMKSKIYAIHDDKLFTIRGNDIDYWNNDIDYWVDDITHTFLVLNVEKHKAEILSNI